MRIDFGREDVENIAQRVAEILQPIMAGNDKTDDQDTIFTKKTLAKYLKVSVKWIDEYKELGMPYVPMKGHVRFRKSDIDKWLDSLNIPSVNRLERIMKAIK